MGARRNAVLGLALVTGALSFLVSVFSLFDLTAIDANDPAQRLFELNGTLGSALLGILLGTLLVYQAASSLGGTTSTAMRFPASWTLLFAAGVLSFPLFVLFGQWQVSGDGRLPWLFPLTNLAIVSIPSLLAALWVASSYTRTNPFAWPLSWREWISGFIYGVVGAPLIAGFINTFYVVLAGAALITYYDVGSATNLDNLASLPRNIGIIFDLSVFTLIGPINEEFWKGLIVALFFFRRGHAARCFVWGVLAGAGFNLAETFSNSLHLIDPAYGETAGRDWWLFASARAATGALHACATGLAALGFYGLLRRKPRYLLAYPAGVLLHSSWNFMDYLIEGDALFSKAGPDSRLLDIVGIAGLIAIFAYATLMLWLLPRHLKDEAPAPLYRILGMLPPSAPHQPFAAPHPVSVANPPPEYL